MRISEYFTNNGGNRAQIAEVTVAGEGRLVAQGQDTAEGMPIFAPFGVSCLPAEGGRILLLPVEDYYVCVGALCGSEGLAPGELVLKSAGGATIALRNNGEVSINGLTVTPDGQLVQE